MNCLDFYIINANTVIMVPLLSSGTISIGDIIFLRDKP